ncbi:MAG: aldose 1-epimerase [Pseudomonadota bacterium]|nr:aldose 1-epimerase [Pseudomonadota bacterium]
MTALITLEHAHGAMVLSPSTGGAIASFDWKGVPVLRSTARDVIEAGDVRRHACYPLVPYSNRIEHGRLTFGGKTHELALNFGDHPHAIHGVGWQRSWTVQSATSTTALLSLEHRPGAADSDDARAWPWPFAATQWFQLSEAGPGAITLRMKLTISNIGKETFPFGLGWHPFFPCEPLTRLAFTAGGVWETDATMIPTAHVPAQGLYSFDPGRAIGDAILDNIYTEWSGEAELSDHTSSRITTLRGDTTSPYFVVYIPPHHTFLAIEPVTQMTDAFNRAERGERDTGTRLLAAGESFSSTMEIIARELS